MRGIRRPAEAGFARCSSNARTRARGPSEVCYMHCHRNPGRACDAGGGERAVKAEPESRQCEATGPGFGTRLRLGYGHFCLTSWWYAIPIFIVMGAWGFYTNVVPEIMPRPWRIPSRSETHVVTGYFDGGLHSAKVPYLIHLNNRKNVSLYCGQSSGFNVCIERLNYIAVRQSVVEYLFVQPCSERTPET